MWGFLFLTFFIVINSTFFWWYLWYCFQVYFWWIFSFRTFIQCNDIILFLLLFSSPIQLLLFLTCIFIPALTHTLVEFKYIFFLDLHFNSSSLSYAIPLINCDLQSNSVFSSTPYTIHLFSCSTLSEWQFFLQELVFRCFSFTATDRIDLFRI